MRVPELGAADALLLFLDPPPAFHGQPHGPLQVLIGDGHVAVGVQQLDQPVYGVVDRGGVAAAERAAVADPALDQAQPVLGTQLGPALGEEIAHKPKMIRKQRLVELGHVPAGQVGVDAVHEGGVVAHLRRQRAEQMADTLLVLHVDFEIPNHDDAAVCTDVLLARG